jgi:hypothetical protein
MVKYGTRHWAHYRCWLWSKAAELPKPVQPADVVNLLANSLHEHQIRNFPVLAICEFLEMYGIYGKAVIVIKVAIKIAASPERESQKKAAVQA